MKARQFALAALPLAFVGLFFVYPVVRILGEGLAPDGQSVRHTTSGAGEPGAVERAVLSCNFKLTGVSLGVNKNQTDAFDSCRVSAFIRVIGRCIFSNAIEHLPAPMRSRVGRSHRETRKGRHRTLALRRQTARMGSDSAEGSLVTEGGLRKYAATALVPS